MLFSLAITILILIKLLKSVLFEVKVFQDKEYRRDRLKVYFEDDYKYIIFTSNIFVSVFFTILFFTVPNDTFVIIIILYLLFEIFNLIADIVERILARPKLTQRSILIIIIDFILISLIVAGAYIYQPSFYNSLANVLFLFLIVNALLPFLTTISVILTHPLARWAKCRDIKKASEAVSTHKNLLVIGITGSFAKSSVKNILYQLLSEKYQVLTPPANHNTDIGIARTINESLKPETQILLLEIGAYKKGEIKRVCQQFQLDVGIITGIGNQHIRLFGNKQNLIDAKFELVGGLKKDSILFYNAEDEIIKTKVSQLKVKSIGYTSEGSKDFQILAKDDINDYNLKLKAQKKIYKTEYRLIGKHNLTNLSGAIAVARYLDIGFNQIVKGISKIQPIRKRLELAMSKNNRFRILDDSHNSNINGFKAALEVLNSLDQYNKIVIHDQIIEIDNLEEVYGEIINDFKDSDITFYVLNKQVLKVLKKALPEQSKISVYHIGKLNIKKIENNSVVLIEGRIKMNIYNKIINA